MGAPWFKHRDELMRHQVVVFSSNYALYGNMSARVMETLDRLAPRVDVYSIDEAFLDVSGIEGYTSLTRFGQQVRDCLWKETHLKVGVGIAPTKPSPSWLTGRPNAGPKPKTSWTSLIRAARPDAGWA